MTNALIKTMRNKLGDFLTKEIIFQGCEFVKIRYRTRIKALLKYAKNNDEITAEVKNYRTLLENLKEIEEEVK